jgi:hypothetical protein
MAQTAAISMLPRDRDTAASLLVDPRTNFRINIPRMKSVLRYIITGVAG